ncbi:MAG: hypothetical protein IAE77_25415 [Prosthecobacter sp.]|jgi:hypothetical protein|uniref:hypothetical protein n=1 Tax=Prosthecobacter sp. TaxID=1965333 RepID=UPI0019E0ECD4|nr:hypothetical protein [Prosthecobacter sp.]MBE2286822.1 hypothetical protein [Prosthecobacter sp.]
MLSTTNLPRPEGLHEALLRCQPWVEFYGEPAMPGMRDGWTYLLLSKQPCGLSERPAGTAAMRDPQHGLVQTFSFSAAEMETLERTLAALSLPASCEAPLVIDGGHGWVRLHHGNGSHTDLCWTGGPPSPWQPLLNWMNEVRAMILEKMWDDAVTEPVPPVECADEEL